MASLDLPGAEVNAQAFADSRFGAQAVTRLRAGFERSAHPMLITDDQRRLVSGNPAACGMLGIAREDVCWLTMDIFTPDRERQKLREQWGVFLASGAAEGWYRLNVPDREPVLVEFSGTATVLPSRHLLVFIPPENASADQAESGEAAWSPVASEGSGLLKLTGREREIITLVASGLQTADVAERLFLSPETVKSHVHNAMGKLGSRTRAHAVATALVTGQITWEA